MDCFIRLLFCLSSCLLAHFLVQPGLQQPAGENGQHSLSASPVSLVFCWEASASARGPQESLGHSDSYTDLEVEGVNIPRTILIQGIDYCPLPYLKWAILRGIVHSFLEGAQWD